MEIKHIKGDRFQINLEIGQLIFLEKLIAQGVIDSKEFNDHLFFASFSNKVKSATEENLLKKD